MRDPIQFVWMVKQVGRLRGTGSVGNRLFGRPEADCSVVATGDNNLPVSRHFDAADRAGVSEQSLQFSATVAVPHAQGPICAGGQQPMVVAVPG